VEFHVHIKLITIILGCIGLSCGAVSGWLYNQEIGEVNRKLPDSEQLSYWFWHSDKAWKLKQEYKRLYPDGRLHSVMFAFQIIGLAFFFAAALSTGLFFRH
jgi:hypothetical protein